MKSGLVTASLAVHLLWTVPALEHVARQRLRSWIALSTVRRSSLRTATRWIQAVDSVATADAVEEHVQRRLGVVAPVKALPFCVRTASRSLLGYMSETVLGDGTGSAQARPSAQNDSRHCGFVGGLGGGRDSSRFHGGEAETRAALCHKRPVGCWPYQGCGVQSYNGLGLVGDATRRDRWTKLTANGRLWAGIPTFETSLLSQVRHLGRRWLRSWEVRNFLKHEGL